MTHRGFFWKGIWVVYYFVAEVFVTSHDAKTRTFRSTLPVAMTHRMPTLPPPGSSFFDADTPFTVGVVEPLASPPWLLAVPPSLLIFGAHRIQLTKCWCASDTVRTHLHSCVKSQHRIVLSSLTERRYFPPGWKTSPRTQLSCPMRVLIRVPRESQSRIVLSREPVARNSAGEDAAGGFFRPARVAR